jgi:hypothetical protein
MNQKLQWRAEFWKPGPGTSETIVGHVDGDAKAVAVAETPEGAYLRLKLLTPPDIRLGDHVRYDNGDDEPFVGIVTRVGQPYPSGAFNVDIFAGATKTVFCENCTLVFRPRHKLWKEEEFLALFPPKSDETPEVKLVGREPLRTVRVLRGKDGLWTVTFLDGETKIDAKVYNEQKYGYLREILRAANAWIFGAPVQIGDCWCETINQGPRDVEVVAVKRLRYRIEYEMPNAGMMGSWQTGIVIGGKLYA